MLPHHSSPLTRFLLLILLSLSFTVLSSARTLRIGCSSNLYSFLQESSIAYRLKFPDVTISVLPMNRSELLWAMDENTIDFGIHPGGLTSEEFSASASTRDLLGLPFLAQPALLVHSLPPQITASAALNLSLSTACKIFSGDIQYWNDALIRLDNPSAAAALPAEPIIRILVQSNESSVVEPFLRMCSRVDPAFRSLIPPSSNPRWPLDRYSDYIISGTESSSIVSLFPYSIAMMPLQEAQANSLSMISFLNPSGQVIEFNQKTVQFGFDERFLTIPKQFTPLYVDYAASQNPFAWPLVGPVQCLIHRTYNRPNETNCDQRKAAGKFLDWLLASDASNELIVRYKFARLSRNLVAYISEPQRGWQQNLPICLSASTPASAIQRGFISIFPQLLNSIPIGGTAPLADLTQVYLDYYRDTDSDFSYYYASTSAYGALIGVGRDEFGFSVVTDSQVPIQTVFELPDEFYTSQNLTRDFVAFPSTILAVRPQFRLPFIIELADQIFNSSHFEYPLYPFSLNVSTIARIFMGDIKDWLDPAILWHNPGLLERYTAINLLLRQNSSHSAADSVNSTLVNRAVDASSFTFNIQNFSDFINLTPEGMLRTDFSVVVCCTFPLQDRLIASNIFSSSLGRQSDEFQSRFRWSEGDEAFNWTRVLDHRPNTRLIIESKEANIIPRLVISQISGGAFSYSLSTDSRFNWQTDIALKPTNWPTADPNKRTISFAEAVTSQPVHLSACLDGSALDFQRATLRMTGAAQGRNPALLPNCWLFQSVSAYFIRSKFFSDAALDQFYSYVGVSIKSTQLVSKGRNENFYSESAVCIRAYKLMNLLEWLITNEGLHSLAIERGMLPVFSNANVKLRTSEVEAFLTAVTCDGQPIMTTLPVYWQLGTGIIVLGDILVAISVLFCLAGLVILFMNRSKPVIRSSSYAFLSLIQCGLLVLGLSALNLAVPTLNLRSANHCTTFNWMFQIGISLTFAPLFVKIWRIRKIFSLKKLKLIKISNKRLFAMVGALILFDLIILSVQEHYGPIRPIEIKEIEYNSITKGNTLRIYLQCSIESTAIPFMVIFVIEKAALIGFGAVMAFGTRKVDSALSDSAVTGYTLYNAVVALVLVIPIIFLLRAQGDAFILLMFLLVYWIFFGSYSILFGPKFYSLARQWHEKRRGIAVISVLKDHSDETQLHTDDFSLTSFTGMDHQTLQVYIQKLEEHAEKAKKHMEKVSAKQGTRPPASPISGRPSVSTSARGKIAPNTVQTHGHTKTSDSLAPPGAVPRSADPSSSANASSSGSETAIAVARPADVIAPLPRSAQHSVDTPSQLAGSSDVVHSPPPAAAALDDIQADEPPPALPVADATSAS